MTVAIKPMTEETSALEAQPVTHSVPINKLHAMLNDDKRFLDAQNRK
jgi:hypothetical protein